MQNTTDITLQIIDGPESAVDEDGWWHYAYKLKLKHGRQSMTIPWRQGEALTDPPQLSDVMEALLSDAATVENAQSFEDWASELGYDPDSREAEKIYKQVERQTDRLRSLLGDEYDSAVFPEDASTA